jgi:uncharacterized protein YkwD
MARSKLGKNANKSSKPKKTRREFELLGGTAVATAAFLVISIFLASSLDVVIIRSQQYASVVAAVLVDLANTDRSQNRLDGLTINPVLVKAAQAKADDMAAKSYFAHTSPQGIDPWYWFNQAGYKFSYAGENLAIDFSDSDAVNSAWMNSPTHRANILDQHYTEIGIATAEGMYQGHMTTFVVQEFGSPAKTKTQPTPQATSVPANPTVPATASAAPASKVLGESTVQKAPASVTEASGPSISVSYASPVAHAVASPNQTLKYIYYGIAAVIILLLAIATGFELHVRHLKKAAGAAFLLALMLFLFVAGTKIMFVAPSVPQDTSMAAAAIALQ